MDTNLKPLGYLYFAVYFGVCVCVAHMPPHACGSLCTWTTRYWQENSPLITIIFSCNLKAITISLGVRENVNMVHLFEG